MKAEGTFDPVTHGHGLDVHAHQMPKDWVHQHTPGDGTTFFKTHEYVTTWTTPITQGPMAGEMGPDLDKPCPECRGSWREHLTLSRIEAQKAGPT